MSAIFTYLYRVLEHCEESEYSIRSNSYASCGVEHVAEECAADYQRNHGGRESNWPLTFKVFDVGGKHLGTCIVEREVRPVFSAVLLSKESQIAAKAAELFGHLAPPGDGGGGRVTELRPPHKCKPVARIHNMMPGREWWLGELTETVPEWPHETHCLHIKTPLKDIVLLCNMGDLQGLTVLCNIPFPIRNPTWLERMEAAYRRAALGIKPSAPQPAGEQP